MGIRPGDKVAIIMNGTAAYWAHLAKLRIVAEIMDTGHGSQEFWKAPQPTHEQVYDLFARSHAKAAVAFCPAEKKFAGWEAMQGTPYCVHRLQSQN
jgi:hypothetical protein